MLLLLLFYVRYASFTHTARRYYYVQRLYIYTRIESVYNEREVRARRTV